MQTGLEWNCADPRLSRDGTNLPRLPAKTRWKGLVDQDAPAQSRPFQVSRQRSERQQQQADHESTVSRLQLSAVSPADGRRRVHHQECAGDAIEEHPLPRRELLRTAWRSREVSPL